MVAARGAWAPLYAAALACACAARAHAHTQRAAGFVGPEALPPRAERAAGRRWGAPKAFSTAAERLTKNEPVLREIAIRLSEVGLGKSSLVQDKSLGPGLHNLHYRFETAEGPVFVKVNHRFGFVQNFQRELECLKVLAATETVRVPRPITCGVLSDGHSFLAMEYMEPLPFGPSVKAVARGLGEGLAKLHMAPVPFKGEHYGFQCDTYLGMAVQSNEWMEDFSDFFIERRLRPQLMLAASKFAHLKWGEGTVDVSPQSFESLLTKVRAVLEPVKHVRPSLLHGDLWQGNTGATKEREPFMHDPACWYGHSEFDLALASMFGGFLPEFYEAYHALVPRAEGFEARQEVYRLYHYLHHLNTFGLGFGASGSIRDPKGYYERTLQLMRSITSNNSK